VKTSIATVSLSGDLTTKLDAIASSGFDGYELFENDFTFSTMTARELRMRTDDLGLDLVCLQPFRDFEGQLDARRTAAFDRAERKFDLMAELGTDLLMVCSSVSPHAVDGVERYASDFHELGERAAARGLRVAYEALAWGRHVRDWMQAWEVVRRCDHPSVGLVLDTYHLFVRGNPIAPIRGLPAEKIFLVQLADAPSLDMEILRHSRHLRNFPGQGDYPIVDFLVELTSTGYDGFISHEIFNDEFRIAPAAQTAIDGYRSMIWLDEQVRRTRRSRPHLAAADSGSGAFARPSWTGDRGVDVDPSFRGVAFVEFGVADDDEATELASFFEQLGFARTHRHLTKRVDLHSRGGTYLAINAEAGSYARSFAERHGAAACAIGLETPSPDAALARAVAYLAPEVVGAHHAGQIRMPAISGVGGSLLYFVGTGERHFTETDFEPVPGAITAAMFDGPSLRIDHIAQAVAPHELLSVLLFYRAALGFDLQPPLELVDPNGLVTSRTVVSPNGFIRFPLNTASSRDTSPERFRSEVHGSGVQHIAIATGSIGRLVGTIDPSVVLAIPSNYYDDVEARFGLDPATLAFLRANNVLYDRSDDGEFFHLYTHEIHGVFFEFVQRNSYAGFGAANAPVRLAAQSRSRSRAMVDA
jgi:4-hydroxyphenylpyruvate dioxygenase